MQLTKCGPPTYPSIVILVFVLPSPSSAPKKKQVQKQTWICCWVLSYLVIVKLLSLRLYLLKLSRPAREVRQWLKLWRLSPYCKFRYHFHFLSYFFQILKIIFLKHLINRPANHLKLTQTKETFGPARGILCGGKLGDKSLVELNIITTPRPYLISGSKWYTAH